MRFYSPLRYPGGKGKLAPFIELLIDQYGHRGGTYIEPFAGGAGVAIELLEKKVVSDIVINDLDKGIYSFWRAVLTDTDRFIDKVKRTPLNIDEWKRQRKICFEKNVKYSFDLGFATFYMNRTNRSGIIKGGVIGGMQQAGSWKLDARFNKKNLIVRIEAIAKMKKHIHLYNKDIDTFLNSYIHKYEDNAFVYFDPPYFEKGKQLYMNFFSYEDHVRIAESINKLVDCDWVITYDDTPEIERIYEGSLIRRFDLNYSAGMKRRASEIIVFKNNRSIPSTKEIKAIGCDINLRD